MTSPRAAGRHRGVQLSFFEHVVLLSRTTERRSFRSACCKSAHLNRSISTTDTPNTHEILVNLSIDSLDARLIAALRKFPRVGLLEIARQLGVARGTVQARLAKLEARGVITGHGPEVDPVAMGYAISAFILIELAQGELAAAVDGDGVDSRAARGRRDLRAAGPHLPRRRARHRASAGDRQPADGDAGDPALHELHRAHAPGAAADDAADRGGSATRAGRRRVRGDDATPDAIRPRTAG